MLRQFVLNIKSYMLFHQCLLRFRRIKFPSSEPHQHALSACPSLDSIKKVMATLTLCLTKHYAMLVSWLVDYLVKLHSTLITAAVMAIEMKIVVD